MAELKLSHGLTTQVQRALSALCAAKVTRPEIWRYKKPLLLRDDHQSNAQLLFLGPVQAGVVDDDLGVKFVRLFASVINPHPRAGVPIKLAGTELAGCHAEGADILITEIGVVPVGAFASGLGTLFEAVVRVGRVGFPTTDQSLGGCAMGEGVLKQRFVHVVKLARGEAHRDHAFG